MSMLNVSGQEGSPLRDSFNAPVVTRAVVVKDAAQEVTVRVPVDIWQMSQHSAQSFHTARLSVSEESVSPVDLLSYFIRYLCTHREAHTECLLRVCVEYLVNEHLDGNDIHCLDAGGDPAVMANALSSTFLALPLLKNLSPYSPKSKFITAAQASAVSISPVFGGQGYPYMNELSELYAAYKPLIHDLLVTTLASLHTDATSHEAVDSCLVLQQLNVMEWLKDPSKMPSEDYLTSAPVSMPLIGLTQLMQYAVSLKAMGMVPGDMRRVSKCASGHSQGVLAAVVVAASSTWEEFVENCKKAVRMLFWMGLRSQEKMPLVTCDPKILQDSHAEGEGIPQRMLAVTSLPVATVTKVVQDTNQYLDTEKKVHVSLINGTHQVVISGPDRSLYGLNVALRKMKGAASADQSRVPYSKRKTPFTTTYLSSTVPFHSVYLADVPAVVLQDFERLGLGFTSAELQVPVLSTLDGEDLRSETELTKVLTNQILARPVDWPSVCANVHKLGVTHVLDFGPGGVSGCGKLVHHNVDGTGTQVVIAGDDHGVNTNLLTRKVLYDTKKEVPVGVNWAKEYAPKLIKSTATGEIHIDTKYSRLLGRPPICVPGMTPTTISGSLISATLNAGFQIEISGGGHFATSMLDAKIAYIQEHTKPGEGVTLNMLFLNPNLWGQQYPHIQKLRKAGIPIEGVTIAAGVPSPDKAHEFLTAFKECGIKHVSFKPGSEATIRQVVAIAEGHPDVDVVMQWTGGRSGGHHSFEDQHDPIIRTYGLCRRQPNLVLVAGGGLGDAESTLKWLTGEWSHKFGRPSMPFDGVLMGSRLMVAKEAETSLAVKELIAAAPGITEEEEATWETTYAKPHGGILTVTSELGEPIHKIANRGVKFWKELDDTIFSLPKAKQLPAIMEKKKMIIEKLNADSQKVFFPRKLDGTVVETLDEMTYEEVAHRLVALLFEIGDAWLDITMRNLTGKWLRRVEERFAGKTVSTMVPDFSVLSSPKPFLQAFFQAFPGAKKQTLSSEDVDHFVALCAFPAQKPVPFIPRLDERFNTWYKKDSLWQSEKLEFVVGHDAQRVNILHGPVAARYSTEVNEPVADMLGGIYKGQIDGLLERGVTVTDVEYFGGPLPRALLLEGVNVEKIDNETFYTVTAQESSELPTATAWFEAVSGSSLSWLKALFCCDTFVKGVGKNSRWVENPLQRILKPRMEQRVVVREENGMPVAVTVFTNGDKLPAVQVTREDGALIKVTLFAFSQHHSAPLPLELRYFYHPECGAMPIREDPEGRVARVKDFYSKLWLGDALAKEAIEDARVPWELRDLGNKEDLVTLERHAIIDFCRTVGNRNESYTEVTGTVHAPMDFAMVVGWKSVVRALFAKHIDGDLLSLVHLGNSFRTLKPGLLLKEGDKLASLGEVTSVTNDAGGNKVVEVRGTILKDNEPVIEILSKFLYRSAGGDWDNTFSRETHVPYELLVKDSSDSAVCRSKAWVNWTHPDLLIEGTELTFNTSSEKKFKVGGGFSSLKVTGSVMAKLSTKEDVEIGVIDFEGTNCAADPVESFLKKHAVPVKDETHFDEAKVLEISDEVFDASTKCPDANHPYSMISGDTNPIHTNPYFADLAGLPDTIVHGMWSSAAVRRLVETFAADNNPARVVYYSAEFTGMVMPGDVLSTNLAHMGMTQGRKLFHITVTTQHGSTVLKGVAEVEEAPTAYVFTGQGSQSKGMGMDLYKSSEVARELWDRADFHLKYSYGFSILDIVRRNPNELTIHFGGKHGAIMRENYRKLVYEVVMPDGTMRALPLFPDVTPTTTSHTFYSPKGLLNATQFTQPALTLMEVAGYKDLEEKGLVQKGAVFAGHSLGEYSSLAALAEVLSIEALVDVVFYRGMTMQVAVPRDAKGRSDYGMVAVNPSRVGEGFNQEALQFLVDAIAELSKHVIQIVNYNVVGQQYVTSGELTTLDCLSNVLNYIKLEKINVDKLLQKIGKEDAGKKLNQIVETVYEKCLQKKKLNGGRAVSERGFATIPLPGIDVPFHSAFLLSGVAPFRALLKQKLSVEWVDVKALKNRYIPNLVARPFELSKEFTQLVYDASKSPVISQVLGSWKNEMNAGEQQTLGYTLLIELLAYQFASPVRWIETQDVIFAEYGIERLVEIGPEPTLTTMASRTLKAKYEKHDDASSHRRTILHVIKQHDELYYSAEGAAPAAAPAASTPAAAPAAPVPAPVAAAPAPAAAASSVADAKVTTDEILQVLVTTRVRKPMAEVPMTKSIKELVGGKSTLQNEILGDLGQEFPGFQADKPEEEPLKALAGSITGTGSLGKVTGGMVTKMVGSKMPGGFGMGQVKGYLGTTHGLGAGRTEAALLHGLTIEPASRMANEADAKKWLDTVAASYAAAQGITLGAPAAVAPAAQAVAAVATSSAPAAVPDAPVSSVEFIRVLVASKMKVPASADLDRKSIKELVAGKSTLQNEMLGDLQLEFGDAVTKIDGAAEMPLGEVAKLLSNVYKGLGKYGQRATQKLVSAKMPGSFGMSAVKAYLGSKGLASGRQDGVLLHALASEPPARLGSDADAKSYWDTTCSAYASLNGVTLGGGGGGVVMAAGPAIPSAELEQMARKQEKLIRQQMELFSNYLGEDLRAGWQEAENTKKTVAELQRELDAIKSELGEYFVDGVVPKFSRKKARSYEASWNWAKQDYVKFFLDMTHGVIAPPTLSVEDQRLVFHIMNRADVRFFQFIEYYTKVAMARGGNYFQRLRAAGYMLAREIPSFAPVWMLDFSPAQHILASPPTYTPVEHPMAPCTTISSDGVISYKEVPRQGVASYVDYAKEMARGIDLMQLQQDAKVRRNLSKLQRLGTRGRVAKKELATILEELNLAGLHTGPAEVESEVDPEAASIPKRERSKRSAELAPLLNLKGRSIDDPMNFEYSKGLTTIYLQALNDIANNGITFIGKVALCTGCGRGSIGIEVVKVLLAGGCKVICTTSSYSKAACDFYRDVYEKWGAKGSKLNVVPFNGGSSADVQAVVDYVYDDEKNGGMGTDIDFIIPFAAISEQGMEIDNIGSKSELAHRIMLTNVLRLLGAVKVKKELAGQLSRPTQTILPMSPNHGLFGGDGLYAESKIGLEVLFNKWHSEHWGKYLTIVGASIGWTRGTGLMAANNLVAEGIEKLGVRTFSTTEMSMNLIALMHPKIIKLAERDPVWADLNGGLHLVENLNSISSNLRLTIREIADVRAAVATEKRREEEVIGAESKPPVPVVNPRANMKYSFPKLKAYDKLHKELGHMKGMVDPSKVVVITGYGEVGPWGSSRTRWQMEANGTFSLEGCIEMAWAMGFITYKRDPKYSGWVDAKSGKQLKDSDIKKEYEEEILKHSGVRLVEPELHDGYDPKQKTFLHQVSIDNDMAPVECGEDEAKAFKLQHGDSVDIYEKGDGVWVARLRKGAQLYIPKALNFSRNVAGQVPTGWDAARYGIPKDIINQVDPVTLFTLVSTAEALITSGVTDPYEFYKYIHVSELGNTSGGGIGGMRSLQGIFRKRMLDQPVQKDILQESFINVMPAWVNLLLLSSSGPIKTPVGACATAVESVEIGVETILSGKAKVVIAGGYDDFTEEGSYEFANMKATSDGHEELLKGRTPQEMSRPTTTSRAGFMESQGAGIHVMMSAEVAFEMGVPIYGIVALTNTATDKEGRSVPAPGQGILTTARENRGIVPQRVLEFNWRKKQLQAEREGIARWVQSEHEYLQDEVQQLKEGQHKFDMDQYVEQRLQEIKEGASRKEQAALDTFGQGFYRNNPSVAPLRGALAVYGLDVDDISVASFHGTSTQANDLNESEVVNSQVAHLGRSKGNLLPTVFQKWLTGHPKGAAAAWMLNGCLQMLEHQVVPGNRNADNVDSKLNKFTHLFFPSKTLKGFEVKACLLKSFGFGQVGGEALVVHADYILATLDEAQYGEYAAKRAKRQQACYNHYHQGLTGGKIIKVKEAAPYTDAQTQGVYLDPLARAALDRKTGEYNFAGYHGPQVVGGGLGEAEKAMVKEASVKGIGCDVEMVGAMPLENKTFLERNFTAGEMEGCMAADHPRSAFTGKWSAKEAVIKAVSSFQPADATPVWDGPSAPLRDIEINSDNTVTFHGDAAEAVKTAGVNAVSVSLSHTSKYCIAYAQAK